MQRIILRGGHIVNADADFAGDVLVENGVITQVGRHMDAPDDAEVIDVQGKLVFPGFIDVHTHIYLPFSGTCTADTYETGSRAALMGGTTCLFDFVAPERGQSLREAMQIWKDKSVGQSYCDHGLHMTVSAFNASVEQDLCELIETDSLRSIKLYLAYKDSCGISDDDLYKTLQFAREHHLLSMIHCENAALVDRLRDDLVAEGHTGPEYHYASRPPCVEAEGVHHAITCAELTDAPIYIVHVSCKEALQEIMQGRKRGLTVYAETCPHYLLLDKSRCEGSGFERAKWVVSPPLREKYNQQILWNALAQGWINTVATDHAPTNYATQKMMGKDDFRMIPNGLPGIENRIELMYSAGVAQGHLSLQQMVKTCSAEPAKLFRLKNKGAIRPGADADIVVFDPDKKKTIRAAEQSMNVDYNAYEGMTLKGVIDQVLLHGQTVVEHGLFTATKPTGHYIGHSR